VQEIKQLDILYEDNEVVAINKPHGLLVHKTNIATDAKEFAVQILRNQIGTHVFPLHRLDRKTSGILIFAKDKFLLDSFYALFRERTIDKSYQAIVRGYTEDEGVIDYELINEKGKLQEASTIFRTIKRYELNIKTGIHSTSRYSHVELKPLTGRMHQLRKHMAHIFHPIIGDRPHGCNKQNKYWKDNFDMTTMLLHASHLSFIHPVSKGFVEINAPFQDAFRASFEILESNSVKI